LFNFLYGVKLKDTQTGLRAFSTDIMPWLIELKGARFEYEMNMLIHSKNADIALIEHPIKTKYEENHKSTYSTFKDSARVAKVLLGPLVWFIVAALVACAVDITGFALLEHWILPEFFNITNPALSILISTVGARAVSSIINFCCNRFLTFGGKKISKSSIWKYYMLFFAQICASYALVYGFTMLFGGGQVFIKIVIDVILSICSYQVQMRWVFKKKSDKKRGAAQTEAVENTEEAQA
jgi:putative flippase GtrA